jgi:hypothetical protein
MQKAAGSNQCAVSSASERRTNAAEQEIEATPESTTSRGVHLQMSRERFLSMMLRKMTPLIQNTNFIAANTSAEIARTTKAETTTATPPGSEIVGKS